MKSLGPPPKRNHESYFNWVWTKRPLRKGYDDYIRHASDFVSISGSHPNYFEELIRRHITWWRGSPVRVSSSNEARDMGMAIKLEEIPTNLPGPRRG